MQELGQLAAFLQQVRPALYLDQTTFVSSGSQSEMVAHFVKAFGLKVPSSMGFAMIADILENKLGRSTLLKEVFAYHESEVATQAQTLQALTLHGWRAIYTKSHSVAIERAFRDITVVSSPRDYGKITTPSLFKLHGAPDAELKNIDDRCVLTRRDLMHDTKHRTWCMDRMATDIAAGGFLAAAKSLKDDDFYGLVQELLEKQRSCLSSSRVWVLLEEVDSGLEEYIESEGALLCQGTLGELIRVSSRTEPPSEPQRESGELSFSLPHSLKNNTRVVQTERIHAPNVSAMWSGRSADYAEIQGGFTFERDAEQAVLRRVKGGDVCATAIIGVAGLGKTTMARRVLYRLANEPGFFCWEHISGSEIHVRDWIRVHGNLKARNLKGILFIDAITHEQRKLNHLISALSNSSIASTVTKQLTDTESPDIENVESTIEQKKQRSAYGLHVICTSELYQWQPRQKDPEFLRAGGAIQLDTLSRAEVDRLISLLDVGSVYNLVPSQFRRKSQEAKRDYIRSRCSREMFVALKLIFQRGTIDDIIINEYSGLTPFAQDVYKQTALLECIGLKVHRQMIFRALRIPTNAISNILNELEGLIFESEDLKSEGVYLWSCRHFVYARTITEYKYHSQAAFHAALEDSVGLLNPSIRVERGEFLSAMCSKEYGIGRITDREKRLDLYLKLRDIDRSNRVPWHRIVGHYLKHEDLGLADGAWNEAIKEVRLDPTLQKYKVDILLMRASKMILDSDRLVILGQAIEASKEGLDRYPDSMYMYITAAKAARQHFNISGSISMLESALTVAKDGLRRTREVRLEKLVRDLEAEVVYAKRLQASEE